MHYTLHQLKIFLKVAECQSITKASEELHLTQPAVSIQLKKLQEQFEIPLTEVVGRQLYTTDFGKTIAERSRIILEEADSIRYTIDQYKGLLYGKIRIAVVSTGKYVMPYFLKSFMDQFPGVEISIDVSNKNRVVEGLIKNESDFSLVSVLPDDLDLNKVELLENKLYLVKSSEFGSPIKRIKDLEKETLLYRELGSATRNAMEKYLNTHDVKVNKRMELVSNEAIKQGISAGLGLSIVPLIGLRNELANGSMEIVPMKDLPIVTNWNLVYNKGKKMTPAQETLIRYLEQNKVKLTEKHFSWTLDRSNLAGK